MSNGRIIKVLNKYKVVTNLGIGNVELEQKFRIIKLGELIIDPDTKEELGQLEIPCGNVKVISVQEKMSIMESSDYDIKETKRETKIITKHEKRGAFSTNQYLDMLSTPEKEVIETYTPGNRIQKELDSPSIGDMVVRIYR